MRQLVAIRRPVLAAAAALAAGLAAAPSALAASPPLVEPPVHAEPLGTCVQGGSGMPPGFGPGYRAGIDVLSSVMGVDGVARTAPARESEIRSLLGAQHAGVWVDAWRDGWFVGLAPGPLDTTAARALLLDRLLSDVPANFSAQTIADARAALHVVALPYSSATLEATTAQFRAALAAEPQPLLVPMYGIGCDESDGAVRLLINIYDPTSAAEQQRLLELLEPFGGQTRLIRRPGQGPSPALGGPGVPPLPALPKGSPAAPPAPQPPRRAKPAPSAASVRGGAVRVGTRLNVTLVCPAGAPVACAGTLSVRLTGSRGTSVLPRRAFAGLPAGGVRTVTVPLTRAQARALRGPRPAATVAAVVRTGTRAARPLRLRLRSR